MDNTKILVLYVFHKFNYNVEFFIKYGIFYDPNVDFIIIINNETIQITAPDYVKVMNRPNNGYDFGGWSDGLLTNNLYQKYDKFIFVNSSVLGPIVPKFYKNKWINIFLDGLTNDVKLYGCTINSCGFDTCKPSQTSHVQSYVYCMDKNTLNYLISKEIFSQTNYINDYKQVVMQREIRMSREIINNNWNIGCVFSYYNNIDFRNISNIEAKFFNSNIANGKYNNEIVHPYEIIFIKDKYIRNKKWLINYMDNTLSSLSIGKISKKGKRRRNKEHFSNSPLANNNNIYMIIFILSSVVYYIVKMFNYNNDKVYMYFVLAYMILACIILYNNKTSEKLEIN